MLASHVHDARSHDQVQRLPQPPVRGAASIAFVVVVAIVIIVVVVVAAAAVAERVLTTEDVVINAAQLDLRRHTQGRIEQSPRVGS